MKKVNNVGMSYDYPSNFLEIDDGANFSRKIVALNVTSVNAVTRAVLPGMAERGRGAVVNVSSMFAMIPAPMYVCYGATKAYVDNFSANLDREYGRKGITVQCVLPGNSNSNIVL